MLLVSLTLHMEEMSSHRYLLKGDSLSQRMDSPGNLHQRFAGRPVLFDSCVSGLKGRGLPAQA